MRTNWKKNIFEIIEQVGNAKQISILVHHNPDGDAIGSGLAMYHFLKSKNKNVDFIVPNGFPAFLKWIPGSDEAINAETQEEIAHRKLSDSDLIFCLDFNHSDRVNNLEMQLLSAKASKVLVDHHPDPESFCDYIFSDISSSSTAELVFEFIKIADPEFKLSKDIASGIYTGIMTDTGNFSYNSSKPQTFKIIADLLETGIDKDKITSAIYDNFSADRMKLLGLSLNQKMKVMPELKMAYIALQRKDLYKYNFRQGDSEGFVNYPLSIKGIDISALFIEHKEFVKISFRSKGNFPVNRFSEKYFNGGGHKNAAGGNMNKSLSETLEMFEELLPKYLEELKKENNA